MNRIFKVIWSETKHAYCVVSEIAHTHRRTSTRRTKAASLAAVFLVSVAGSAYAALTSDQQVVYDAVIQQLAQTSGKATLGKVKVDNDKETLSLGYVQWDGKHGNLYLGTKAAGNEVGTSQTQYTHGIPGSNIAWGSGNVAGLELEAQTKETTVDGKKTNIITGYKRERQADGFSVPLWNINSSGDARSYSTAIGFLNAAYGVGAFSVGQYSAAGADSAFAGGYGAIASAKQAFAFGKEVKAMGENSVALGEKSEAWATNSFALGNTAKAQDVGAVAMGNSATASGKSSFAAGVKSNATAYSTVALGDNAEAGGNYSVAMGHKAKATEENSSAVGAWAKATGEYSSALGASSKALGFLSTAVGGGKVKEDGDRGLSMGYGAQTTVADGVSVGSDSVASRSGNVYGYNVLGGNAYDTESIGAAYGQGKKEEIEGYDRSLVEKQPQLAAAEAAYHKAKQDLDDMFHGRPGALEFTSANREKLEAEIARTKQVYENLQKEFDEIKAKRNTLTGAYLSSSAAVSVGNEEIGMTRQITGVAAGTKDTDAVNVAQLKALNKKVDGKKDIHFFSANGSDSGINYDNQGARAGYTTAVGPDAMATEENSQAFGYRARAIGHSSIVFGVESTASGARDIAIGYGSHAVGSDNTNTSWNDTIAIGWNALSRGGSFASGTGAVAGGSGSVALGAGAYVGTKWLDDKTEEKQHVNKWVLTRYILDDGLKKELEEKFPEKFVEWKRRASNMPAAIGSEYLEQKLYTLAMEQLPLMTSPSMKKTMKDMESSIAIGRRTKVYSASAVAIGSEAKVGENLDGAIALGNQSLATRNAGIFGYDPTSDAKTWTDFKKAHPEAGIGAAREQEIQREMNDLSDEVAQMGPTYQAWVDKEKYPDKYLDERKAYAEAHGNTLNGNNEWVEWVLHARNEQQKLWNKGQELTNKYNNLQKELNGGANLGKGAWIGNKAALAIGNEEDGITRQITGVAAGTKDTDAVNVAQLKVLNTKVDKVAEGSVHYLSVNSSEQGAGSNYKNDGAVGENSIAIGNKAEAFHWGSSAVGNQAWSIGAFSQAWGWCAIASGEPGIDKETYDKLSEAEKKNYQLYSFLLDRGDKSLYYRTKYEEYTPEEYRDLPADRQKALDKIGYQYSEARKKEIMAPRSLAIGIGARAVGKYTTAVGNWVNAAGIQATALGTQAKATGDFSIAAGNLAEASGGQSVAVGTHAKSDGAFSTAVGVQAKSSGQLSIAVGFKAVTNFTESIAVGNKAETVKGWSAAIGSGAKTQGTASTAVGGLKVSATVDYGAAFGSFSVAQREKGVSGYLANGQAGLAWKSNLGAFSVGDDVKGYSRQITGVAAGSEDTDAVNVAQLKAIEKKIGTGGTNGKDGKSAYDIWLETQTDKTKTKQDFLDSLKGKDGKDGTGADIDIKGDTGSGVSVTSNTESGKKTYTIGLSTKIKAGEVTIDGTKDKENIAVGDVKINGEKGKGTITGLSNKTWDPNHIESGRAATEDQLKAVTQGMTEIFGGIAHVGAHAAALAALHPLDFNADEKLDLAAGVGNYNGANAVAVGAYYRPNERTMFSIGGSFGSGKNMVNGGVSLKVGSGSVRSMAKAVPARQLAAQQREIREQRAQIQVLQQRDKDKEAQIQALWQEIRQLKKLK
ncbi:ESPR-type extended signal peptide-containing protein [uncultured Megasphaera sp.]|uniref:ESPR-type extended signal peptide-containing protein n=1 Tax=uncultured Megasphaera sp. TaxID=165188 RepID=UPI002595EFF7|nr:ESPR-type extended signal peptide-containing protein [uncultured Megasphaera sp.]